MKRTHAFSAVDTFILVTFLAIFVVAVVLIDRGRTGKARIVYQTNRLVFTNAPKTNVTTVAKPSFVYPTNPAPGWSIVCDSNGRFAAREDAIGLVHDVFIQTTYAKAVEHSWNWHRMRLDPARKAPEPKHYDWKLCE